MNRESKNRLTLIQSTIFDARTKATQRSKDSFFNTVLEHLGAQMQKKKKNIDTDLTLFTNIMSN